MFYTRITHNNHPVTAMTSARACYRRQLFHILVSGYLLLSLAGCEFIGPKAVRSGRTDYNAAIKQTDIEQLLLNIVRLRFSDRPYFLEVASITASVEASAAFGRTEVKNVQGGIVYTEKPNILYLPLTGEQFVRQLLEPVELETLVLLRGAGWEIDDILRVFANRINAIPNAPTGGGSTPEGTPEYRKYLELAEALDELEDHASLVLAVNMTSADELELSILPHGREMAEFTQFSQLLDLDPEADRYRVIQGVSRGGRNEIALQTRPIMSAMFYLGQGIDIPDDVRRSGFVNSGLADDEQGEPFDWSVVFEELFRVRHAREKPANAYVAVQYDDYWYYIDYADVGSKETLTMLSVVLTLKAGGAGGSGPVLTLPVGGS